MSARFALHGVDGSLEILELAADGTSGSSQSAPPLPNRNGSASKRSIGSSSREGVVWVVTRSLRASSEELCGAFGDALWRDERHDGVHGRYILRSKVDLLIDLREAA
jgi:hypothetical protein